MASNVSGILRKGRLTKFNGSSSESFVSHLKEREFRFNHRGEERRRFASNFAGNYETMLVKSLFLNLIIVQSPVFHNF